jgi:glycolate oxidase
MACEHDHFSADTPAQADPAQRRSLAERLRAICDQQHVLAEPEELKPYECDGLSAYRHVPLLVVLPDSAEQVQQVLQLCRDEGVPVIARGAGTGLSGGALPREDAVLLSLARFNKILGIDRVNARARVQPGVRNLAISEAAKPYGLYYAPDPSSQIACSIGGNVAENAGGVHCLKYGLTVHNLLALSVVTIDGELVTIGGGGLDAPGYDLLALMTGSEGMLGVVVEARLKLLPVPESIVLLQAAFPDWAGAAASSMGESS